jgi:murein DD-endopeptidase MepM/ murein hydrolase activator NlpD
VGTAAYSFFLGYFWAMDKETPPGIQNLLPANFPTGSIFPFSHQDGASFKLDLSAQNQELSHLDLTNTAAFDAYIQKKIRQAGARAATGGYNEDRVVYSRSSHFSGQELRSIHLGMDIWTEAGTEVFAPVPGIVHSFKDNAGFGDYGPTVVLEHKLTHLTFYTLYGHLSRPSLTLHQPGKVMAAGTLVGWIGPYPENGDWPPHLHFQVITDLMGHWGDFPGVAALSQREKFLGICPDPAFLIRT